MDDSKSTWQGGAFFAGLTGGRAGCQIFLAEEGVMGRCPDGQELLVPFDQMTLDLGGASGRMWFIKQTDGTLTLFSEDPTLPSALLHHAPVPVRDQVTALMARHQRGRRRSLLICLAVLGALGLVVALAPAALRALAAKTAQHLPYSVDEKLGEMASSTVKKAGPKINEAPVTEAIAALEQALAPHAQALAPGLDLDFEIVVVRSDQINAFALPGGQVVVFSGLLDAAQGPEQVAGVIAHEMSHVLRRHGVQRIAQSLGVVAAVQLIFGDVEGILAVAAEVFSLAAINNYSREHERQADRDAVAILARTGLAPDSLAGFLRVLKEEQGDATEGLAWLSSHPGHDERIRAIKKAAAKVRRKPHRPPEVDWTAVRKAL